MDAQPADLRAIASHTSAWAPPRASAFVSSATAFRIRISGPAVWLAAANDAERRCQRPTSTQLTGMAVREPAATSTDRLRMRFCFAPISSSPS